MVRLLGAALVSGGALALGLGAVAALGRRIAALDAFCAALELLESELALSLPATPELLERLARRSPEPAAGFFAACGRTLERLGELPFETIWEQALSEVEALAKEDRQSLSRLGALLGRYDAPSQCRAARSIREELEARGRRLRAQLCREGRSYGALGLSLGLLCAILLL